MFFRTQLRDGGPEAKVATTTLNTGLWFIFAMLEDEMVLRRRVLYSHRVTIGRMFPLHQSGRSSLGSSSLYQVDLRAFE